MMKIERNVTSSTGFSMGKITWKLTKLTASTKGCYTAGVSTDPKPCVANRDLSFVPSGISYYFYGKLRTLCSTKSGKDTELFGGKQFPAWKKHETLTINLDMDNCKITFSKKGKILGRSTQIEKGTYHPVISVKGWPPNDYQQFKLTF